MLRRGILLLIAGLVLLFTSCTMATSTPTPRSDVVTIERQPSLFDPESERPTPTPRSGVVTIERVEFVVLESDPLQVQARITGYLSDGCTTFAGISQQREGHVITITVKAVHSGAEICTAIAPMLDQSVMLEGSFTPGQYTVIVNGTAYQLTV